MPDFLADPSTTLYGILATLTFLTGIWAAKARKKLPVIAFAISAISLVALFVIDKTNLTREARAGYISQAKAAGFSVAGYYFKSEIQAALERNRQRSGKALIPEKGILGAYRRLELDIIGTCRRMATSMSFSASASEHANGLST